MYHDYSSYLPCALNSLSCGSSEYDNPLRFISSVNASFLTGDGISAAVNGGYGQINIKQSQVNTKY